MARTPGQYTGITSTPRIITKGKYRVQSGPIIIDATYAIDGSNTGRTDELRAGCLMGRINSALWVPLKLTNVAASGFSGSGSGNTGTALPVDNAAFFKTGDQIQIQRTGLGSGAGQVQTTYVNDTIVSVDYTNNVITLTTGVSNTFDGAIVKGRGTINGAGVCRGILLNTVRLLTTEPYNSTQYDKQAQILIEGYVDQNYVLGDLAAVNADWINHYIKQIQFSTEQGSV